jgi:hypothetical protein
MKLLRDPLLHFLIIGAVLFGVFHLARAQHEPAPGEITVTAGQIASMKAIFTRTWQRPPTAKEIEALVRDYIRDEVLYREGITMGLDRDDVVIRRRIRQKMEFVADLTADVEPNDAELKAFVADHPAWFRAEPRFSFSHVYFRASSEGGSRAAELEHLLQALNAGSADASKAGDPFLAGSDFQNLARSDVAQTFGESFAAWMDRSGSGGWEGPVTSAYGVHLVRVSERVEARELTFEEAREAARREWLHGRKVAANDALYEKLRSRYVINVENGPEQTGGEKLAGDAP